MILLLLIFELIFKHILDLCVVKKRFIFLRTNHDRKVLTKMFCKKLLITHKSPCERGLKPFPVKLVPKLNKPFCSRVDEQFTLSSLCDPFPVTFKRKYCYILFVVSSLCGIR